MLPVQRAASVDTTPTCTRADAHFLVRTTQCTIHTALHFSNVGTPHWLQVKRSLCYVFVCTHIVGRSVCPFFFLSCPHLHARLPEPQRPQPRLLAVDETPVPPITGVECLAALPIRPQTQVMSPTFYSYMNEEHTPINVPDSHRSFQCRDDATITSAAEDPEVPYSGAPSSSK